jgi:hypothetical protein
MRKKQEERRKIKGKWVKRITTEVNIAVPCERKKISVVGERRHGLGKKSLL